MKQKYEGKVNVQQYELLAILHRLDILNIVYMGTEFDDNGLVFVEVECEVTL